MAYISVDFELKLPNIYLWDHNQDQGNSRIFTYHGPDKLYLYIGEDGREKYGPVTAEDLADGRPVPADAELYELDCIKNPLIAHLRAPILNELQEPHDSEPTPHAMSPGDRKGYPQYKYLGPIKPQDLYNRFSLRIVNGLPVVDAFTAPQRLINRNDWMTWEQVKVLRNEQLELSDSLIAPDMPASLKNMWMEYRQLLRDLPDALSDVPPTIAWFMFPDHPHNDTNQEGSSRITRAAAFQPEVPLQQYPGGPVVHTGNV